MVDAKQFCQYNFDVFASVCPIKKASNFTLCLEKISLTFSILT